MNIKEIKLYNGTKYVYLKVNGSKRNYLIKRISTKHSSFSKARWLKSNSPIVKNFKPIIELDDKMTGNILYYAFDNRLIVPTDLSFSSYIQEDLDDRLNEYLYNKLIEILKNDLKLSKEDITDRKIKECIYSKRVGKYTIKVQEVFIPRGGKSYVVSFINNENSRLLSKCKIGLTDIIERKV